MSQHALHGLDVSVQTIHPDGGNTCQTRAIHASEPVLAGLYDLDSIMISSNYKSPNLYHLYHITDMIHDMITVI